MGYPETFRGFQIEDPAHWTDFKLNDLQPKPFGDYDVDIKILACGVCASDSMSIHGFSSILKGGVGLIRLCVVVHTVSGGWGEQHFPLCVGHGTLLLYFHLLFFSLSLIVFGDSD